MGGNAFATSGINVVRIDDPLYRQSAVQYQVVLERFYGQVLLPPNAPGKEDHGDIDFLVSQPKLGKGDGKGSVVQDGPDGESAVDDVRGVDEGKALGALATYRNNALTSYAIAHPQQPQQYIQVDIQLCDPAYLPWLYFLTSYGDLVPILGAIHHRLGLIINDKGFWVQLDLPKGANACGIPRNEIAVFLTLDAERMMNFMGLDMSRYREGFESEEEVFGWIRAGRFFRPIHKRTAATVANAESTGNEVRNQEEGTTETKRHMLARFGDYSAQFPSTEDSKKPPADIAKDAASFFGRRQQYDAQLYRCLAQVQDFTFWQQVRGTLSGSASRKARIIKSVKKWLHVEDGKIRVGDHPVERSALTVGTEEELAERVVWITAHWEEVYANEKLVTHPGFASVANVAPRPEDATAQAPKTLQEAERRDS